MLNSTLCRNNHRPACSTVLYLMQSTPVKAHVMCSCIKPQWSHEHHVTIAINFALYMYLDFLVSVPRFNNMGVVSLKVVYSNFDCHMFSVRST